MHTGINQFSIWIGDYFNASFFFLIYLVGILLAHWHNSSAVEYKKAEKAISYRGIWDKSLIIFGASLAK